MGIEAYCLTSPFCRKISAGSTNGGLVTLAEQKKILVSLPKTQLAEIDAYAEAENISRSECIRRAMRAYLMEKHCEKVRQQMEEGYREMGEINLEIARACFCADTETMLRYEESLG